MVKKLSLKDWDVKGNSLIGAINQFGLIINIEVFNSNQIDDTINACFEQNGLGFLLTVVSFIERKNICCAFTSLQEVVYFINSYVKRCNNIDDVNKMYASYRISDDVINEKGCYS